MSLGGRLRTESVASAGNAQRRRANFLSAGASAQRRPVSPSKDQPVRRSPLREWAATPSAAGEPAEESLINPASTNASRAEKAALRVALDAPLSTTARCIASVTAA